MKRLIWVTSLVLILVFSLCGSAFADDSSEVIEVIEASDAQTIIPPVNLEELSNSQAVMRSNGLSATGYRLDSSYLRVTFTNSTNSSIRDTGNVADAVITGEHISGPFSISVPANGSKTYDVYIGNYSGVYVITNDHGYFYFST